MKDPYLSTGMVNYMGVTGSAKAALDSGFIKFYSGTVPADADAALGGATLLCTLTLGGDGSTGLTIDTTATDGVIQKPSAATWSGTPGATGASTFWRWEKTGDTGASSTTDIRLQGLVDNVGSDANLQNTTFTSGVPFTLNAFFFRIPKYRNG